MEIGVSTATLFRRYYNEDSIAVLNEMDAKVVEVFLSTFCEYNKEFGNILKERKGNLTVHSIHSLNLHFEPQLFSVSERVRDDAYRVLQGCLDVAKILDAKYYTLHGLCRFKKNVKFTNYQEVGGYLQTLVDYLNKQDLGLCLENVEWAYYNRVGVLTEVTKYCKNLCTCLDIKQARISGDSYKDYITEMGESLKTVHISDYNDLGKMCLPMQGNFDFEDLFKRLKDVNFNGNILIENYFEDYKDISEVKESLQKLRELKYKIF